jgi:hypothetical protein
MSKVQRGVLCVVSAMLGLAAGVAGSEGLFGHLRESDDTRPLLFSVEVRDEAGALLASPLLVGEQGRKLHLDLSQPSGPHSEPLRMSLDLDPQGAGPRNICLGYRLSIEDGSPRAGRVGLAFGERRSLRLEGAGEPLRLDVVVAKAGSKEFSRILEERSNGLI